MTPVLLALWAANPSGTGSTRRGKQPVGSVTTSAENRSLVSCAGLRSVVCCVTGVSARPSPMKTLVGRRI